ncbi:hypothetical protein EIN_202350 [Entamoeba invadens IP1]|uniref:TLDc domain-containing protein n=1 Tax=Entamoeba invadens IP1 TaxID=370355 RepID=A0A0A1UBP2_ENTIV|nr:hypothetical protein EIN_202350 [Entamoeba invadens IP1]ELP89650.1 hypothetical protein EIN_202350 [Entamoeba invadens IP1]|eukprot:XP_004256421.1 hypothetical protein EIN_202350 [Entamoeba invadens IP1]
MTSPNKENPFLKQQQTNTQSQPQTCQPQSNQYITLEIMNDMDLGNILEYCKNSFQKEDSYFAKVVLLISQKYFLSMQNEKEQIQRDLQVVKQVDTFNESEFYLDKQSNDDGDDESLENEKQSDIQQTEEHVVVTETHQNTQQIVQNESKTQFSYEGLRNDFSLAVRFLISQNISQLKKCRAGDVVYGSNEGIIFRNKLLDKLKGKRNVYLFVLTNDKNFYCFKLGNFPEEFENDWHQDPNFTIFQFMINGEQCKYTWKSKIKKSYEFIKPEDSCKDIIFNCCSLFELNSKKNIHWNSEEFPNNFESIENDQFEKKDLIYDNEEEGVVNFSFVSIK